jgi:hypothetical protein
MHPEELFESNQGFSNAMVEGVKVWQMVGRSIGQELQQEKGKA